MPIGVIGTEAYITWDEEREWHVSCAASLAPTAYSYGVSGDATGCEPCREHAMNSAAMAAKLAVEEHGLTRVLLLDWDVHHGNGTQSILEEDERVLYLSLHRHGGGFFPGTGAVEHVGSGGGAGCCRTLLGPTA